jgi:hypothetical protein
LENIVVFVLPMLLLENTVDRPTTVVSSANLRMESEMCVTSQSWVCREYTRGLRMLPCGAPVLRISVEEVMLPNFTTWGAARQEVQDPVAYGRVQTQGYELCNELIRHYGNEGMNIILTYAFLLSRWVRAVCNAMAKVFSMDLSRR